MIAATDPLEFVPHGRQQVSRHPGPWDGISRSKEFDDCLQVGLEKVSLVADDLNEFWVLRKVPEDNSVVNTEENSSPESVIPCTPGTKNNFEYSDLSDASSLSYRTSEGSIFQRVLGSSRIDSSWRSQHKRYSSGRSETKNSRISGDFSKFQATTGQEKIQTQLDPGFMEDELYVKGNTAVWSRGLLNHNNRDDESNGRQVICCYTMPQPIKQALWVNFYCKRPEFEEMNLHDVADQPGIKIPAICLVDSHHLRIFVVKGEEFVIPMPFYVEKVWTTKFGILIERNFENNADDKYDHNDDASTMFSLTYPLDDLCPVAITRNSSITKLNTTNYKLVYTSEDPSICMIFDNTTKEHSVYKIRKVRCEEKEYGDHRGNSHSVADSSHKLKSRLSMWENLMATSTRVVTPSPMAQKSNIMSHKSRSFSSMAAMSRCQSPAFTDMDNMWKSQSSKKDNMCRSILQDNQSLPPNSYFNCSRLMSHLTSIPDICLEYLWTDTYSMQDNLTGTPALSVFLSEDLVGQWYLCYVLPARFQLSVVKIDFSGLNPTFRYYTNISAKDAINIPRLRMFAILEHCGNVTLYSGLHVVGKLHMGGTLLQHTPSPFVRRQMKSPFPRRSSLLPLSQQSEPKFDEHLFSPVLPSPAQPAAKRSLTNAGNPTPLGYTLQNRADKKAIVECLMDSLENRITLKYSDSTFYRITLPMIANSSLVEYCLTALRQCLPKDIDLLLTCRWYSTRNSIGLTNLSNILEWDIFTRLLFELLGYEDENSMEKQETPGSAKRQKPTACGSVDDWMFLLDNSTHIHEPLSQLLNLPLAKNAVLNSSESLKPLSINPQSTLFPYIKHIHFILHLLYEDFKLNTLLVGNLLPLAELLSKLSRHLGLRDYVLHYWRDFPKLIQIHGPTIDRQMLTNMTKSMAAFSETPINIMNHVFRLLKNDQNVGQYPVCTNVNERSKNIVQICGALAAITHNVSGEVVLDSFTNELFPPAKQNSPQKSVILDESAVEQIVPMMVDMKIDPRYLETLPIGIYYLFYNSLWKCRENPPADWSVDAYRLLWRDDLAAQAQKHHMERDKLFQEKLNIGVQIQRTMPPNSKQVNQITTDRDGMEDIDCNLTKIRFSEDMRLMEARKMLTSSKPVLITLSQRADVSDHDFIEEQEKHLYGICIRTMSLPVGRGMITLRTATPIITEPLPAPVLCLTGKAPPRGNTVELNHIDTPTNMNLWPLFHNGVANGLRITPDAKNIDSTWIVFNKPKGVAESQMEHAGFLMALGLNGHLKHLLVMSTFEYLSNSRNHDMTSVGILLGLSADFRGTCHHFLTTILAIHIEALLPPTSMELDIFHNLQVAGLLGLGLLYQRSAHRHITEVLLSEIGRPPGPEMENSVDRESHSLAAGLALGLVMLKHGDQPTGMSDLNVSDTLHYYMVGGNKRPLTGAQKDKYKTPSFQIREGALVNLDVTAPGATLAIGLIYLGSGNQTIADWMAPPKTQYLLDFVRPDFLMLRILARSLILWDSIEPTQEWVIGEVPETIRPYCMVSPIHHDQNIDYEAMNQAYCNIVAGACFALGLKFAGSADEEAFETLMHFCDMFTSLPGRAVGELAGKATIETCLNVLLLTASMVMAGTGNLEIMRLVRHLRRRVGVANSAIVTYGSHLATHMALGLLFLGGGRYTLSNSPTNVAALICALYPKFPTHSNDNRYHLQAFRHLYVLAVEPRLVIPKDVLSNSICYARLRIVKLDGKEALLKGPGLIPDINNLKKVIVDDERYWPVVFERGRNWDLLTKILSTTGYIEVKQRAGCLDYIVDKFGYHSELARTLTHSKVVPWHPSFNAIVNFTSDETVKHFCDKFLNINSDTEGKFNLRMMQLLTRTTYDSVVKDKLMVIEIMMSLLKILRNIHTKQDSRGIWQLKIIFQAVLVDRFPGILSKDTVGALYQEAVALLDAQEDRLQSNLQNYLTGQDFDMRMDFMADYVTLFDIPNNFNFLTERMRNPLEMAVNFGTHSGLGVDTVSKILKICL